MNFINVLSILSLCYAFTGAFAPREKESPTPIVYGHYGKQLTTPLEKGFYSSLATMVEQPAFSSFIEEFPVYPSAYLTEEELNAHLAGDPGLLSAFHDAKDAFFFDREDLFFVDPNAIDLSIGIKNDLYHVTIGTGREASYALPGAFLNQEALMGAKASYASLLETFKAAEEGKTPQQKIHDAVKKLCELSAPCLIGETPSASTAYGALIERKADAIGYAKAMQALLKQVDVPSILTSGYRLSADGYYEMVCYNRVQLDGAWYLLDAERIDLNGDFSSYLLGEKESRPTYCDSFALPASSFTFFLPPLAPSSCVEPSDIKSKEPVEENAPSAKEIAPSNKAPLEIHSRYEMEFIYEEELEIVEPSAPVEIQVDSSCGAKNGEYFLEDARFDAKGNALRFSFRPSPSFFHQGSTYSFVPSNLIGKESKLAPTPITYAFSFGEKGFSSSLPSSPLFYPPVPIPSFFGLEGKVVSLEAGMQQGPLLLHSASLGRNDFNAMGGAIGEGILSSLGAELTLSHRGKSPALSEGAALNLAFPYPQESSSSSYSSSAFKLFSFSRGSNGEILPESAREIPCVLTPWGVVSEMDSFSSVLLIETRKGEDGLLSYSSRIASGKGEARFSSSDKPIALSKPGETPRLKLVPEKGYLLSYVLQNGEFLDASANDIPLNESLLDRVNSIEVGFVNNEKRAREKAEGIRNLDGMFLSSQKRLDPLDQTSRIILWTVVPILSLLALSASIVYVIETRKKHY